MGDGMAGAANDDFDLDLIFLCSSAFFDRGEFAPVVGLTGLAAGLTVGLLKEKSFFNMDLPDCN